MRLETIQSPLCVKDYSIKLRRVVKVASLDNGRRVKPRGLPKNIKPKAGDTDERSATLHKVRQGVERQYA